MSTNFDSEILECFLDEALDSLKEWEKACIALDKNGGTPENYDALFRCAHNLKGASRAVGLEEFGGAVHVIEDTIQLLRKGEQETTSRSISLLFDAQVFLEEWIVGLKGNYSLSVDASEFLSNFENLEESSHSIIPETVGQEIQPESATILNTIEIPVILPVEITKEPANKIVKSSTETSPEDLEAAFLAAQIEFEAVIPSGDTAQVTKTTKEVSKINIEPKKEIKPAEGTKAEASKTNTPPKTDETLRVAAHKLDELIQLVGELSIHQSIVLQGKRSNSLNLKICQNAIVLAHKITKDLQTSALSLRMQPVDGLFQRLERVARDVARNQGKKVNIVLDGTEVELDRTVIERMTDPLIHVVRNAVDHGIESSPDRLSAGKSELGTITFQAVQDASGVILKIIDDGKGLNSEKILKKAIEKGLIRADEKLTQQQIFNLIFLPGFSTADKLTDISGRGVGMDVVLKAVQSLRGTVDVNSELGNGSTINIVLPTSLSILEALIVRINDYRYAVPMHQLTEIIDVSTYKIESSGSKGRMISLRGEVVPIESLNGYLKTKAIEKSIKKNMNDSEKQYPALIVKESQKFIAFEVDSILGQQQVVIRPLASQMAKLPGFSGCTILGDGEPSIILSLPDLAKLFFKQFKVSEGKTA